MVGWSLGGSVYYTEFGAVGGDGSEVRPHALSSCGDEEA